MRRCGPHIVNAQQWSYLFQGTLIYTPHCEYVMLTSGPRFNIKMSSYQYRKSHCGDKTILRPSYLHNGISYTGKTTSLYWIRALESISVYLCKIKMIVTSCSMSSVGKIKFSELDHWICFHIKLLIKPMPSTGSCLQQTAIVTKFNSVYTKITANIKTEMSMAFSQSRIHVGGKA